LKNQQRWSPKKFSGFGKFYRRDKKGFEEGHKRELRTREGGCGEIAAVMLGKRRSNRRGFGAKKKKGDRGR